MSKALITEQTLTDIAANIRNNRASTVESSTTMTPSEMSNKISTYFPLDVMFFKNPFDSPKEELTIKADMDNNISYKLYQSNIAKKITIKYYTPDFFVRNSQANYLFNGSQVEEIVFDASSCNGRKVFLTYACQACNNLIKITFINNQYKSSTFNASEHFAHNSSALEDVSGLNGALGQYAFSGCSKLKNSFFTNNSTNQNYMTSFTFEKCTSLTDINLKNFFTTSSNAVTLSANIFFESANIKSICFGKLSSDGAVYVFSQRCLSGLSNLKTIIILTDTVSNLQGANDALPNNFNDASNPGSIYVPDTLVDAYKADTNWVLYADLIKPVSELPQEYKTLYEL